MLVKIGGGLGVRLEPLGLDLQIASKTRENESHFDFFFRLSLSSTAIDSMSISFNHKSLSLV